MLFKNHEGTKKNLKKPLWFRSKKPFVVVEVGNVNSDA